jgi:hypothetical protein
MQTRCPFFLQKSGGARYGIKCNSYHGGIFPLYSDGTRLEYDSFTSIGLYNKDMRDSYVNKFCIGDFNACGLFEVGMKSKI